MNEIRYRRDLWKVVQVEGNSCEIGVAEGYYSAEILGWPNNFPKHYLVDRWRTVNIAGDSAQPQAWHDANLLDAQIKVSRFKERAVFLRGDSTQMALRVPDGSLVFLYLDGDHSYRGVMDDLNAWVCKVKSGGVVGFHDYENPAYGVKKAVREFAKLHNLEIHLLPEDAMKDAGCWFYV